MRDLYDPGAIFRSDSEDFLPLGFQVFLKIDSIISIFCIIFIVLGNLSARFPFHDLDLFIGEAVEFIDDLVDQPVGLLDPRQEGPERRHRVLVFPAQVILEPGAAWDQHPASTCSYPTLTPFGPAIVRRPAGAGRGRPGIG